MLFGDTSMANNGFDYWTSGSASSIADIREQKVIINNDDGDIWKQPWFDELMKKIETNGNIEEFIAERNKKLHDEYIAEKSPEYVKLKNNAENKIAQVEDFSSRSASVNQNLDEFEKDIEVLLSQYPPERAKKLKEVLYGYSRTGEFEQNRSLSQLKQKPNSFIGKIKQGRKIKKANNSLDGFIEKYQSTNLVKQLDELLENPQYLASAHNLKLKLEKIVEQDKEGSTYYSKEFLVKQEGLQQEISDHAKSRQYAQENLNQLENDFEESERLPREGAMIRSFVEEIQGEIKKPQQLRTSDYVEYLENLPDNEQVVFNIGLNSGQGNSEKINRILAYNGLQNGSETDQWLVRKETTNNSDVGKYEVFSPVMSAKEAKEIMPKLVADFDRAHLTSGLIVPMKAQDIFKDVQKEPLPQEKIDDGLTKLVGGAYVQQKRQDPNIIMDYDKAMQSIGISSLSELPQTFNSIQELKQQFPSDKYLFSGSTASDDHLSFSARSGRNGLIYATPDLSYAAKYDGVTNVGGVEGQTATGDKYVSSVMGQVMGEDIKIGFINIYEQSSEDKYFNNFGMEDYRKCKDTNTPARSYDICEMTPNGLVDLHRQGQTATNNRLTRDQAINGYVGSYTSPIINGEKSYLALSYDAETYVTPDKNPLKGKLMHIAWGDKEFFVPVSEKTDEITKYILNARQADMKDTFSQNGRKDVLTRLQKQQEEFKQGIVHEIRTPDFIQMKQSNLQQNLDDNKINIPKLNNMANQISELRGGGDPTAILQTSEAIVENTLTHTEASAKNATMANQNTEQSKANFGKVILQKQGILQIPNETHIQQPTQPNNYNMQQKIVSQSQVRD